MQNARAAEEVPESLIDRLQLVDPDADLVSEVMSYVDDVVELAEENLPAEEADIPDPEEDALHELVDTATASTSDASEFDLREGLKGEIALVDEMREIAEADRYKSDRRIQVLVDWIGENMCPAMRASSGQPALWNDTRVIIFTEYEDTQRYIEERLRAAISHTDRAEERISIYSGGTSMRRRVEIKNAFNGEPKDHPLRVLIATDAAREGLNLNAIVGTCSTSIFLGIRADWINATRA